MDISLAMILDFFTHDHKKVFARIFRKCAFLLLTVRDLGGERENLSNFNMRVLFFLMYIYSYSPNLNLFFYYFILAVDFLFFIFRSRFTNRC